MKAAFLLIFLFLTWNVLTAQDAVDKTKGKKSIEAVFTEKVPRIDALEDEEIWKNCPVTNGFTENFPQPNTAASMPTEVRILYSTEAIYIFAKLYDTAPDSVLRQLNVRDDVRSVNADYFGVSIDGMFTQQNSFTFIVTAAGVQADNSDDDDVWDAAWRSSAKITDYGWAVEMEIPYSQLRFPKKEIQTWGINFIRSIRRYREISYWSKIDPKIDGEVQQYGIMEGIERIKPPLRLSFTPYTAAYMRVGEDGDPATPFVRPSATAGTDLKYGINESFTLDVALIPDFGDVQFDNLEVNLSPFEIYYAERRPFFTEGTELFNRADLFYSRRVGNTPTRYGAVYGQLDSTETVLLNPDRTQLINALKLSGRTAKGLGIGIFNALTAPSYAKIQNLVNEETRKWQTEPLTNYNVFVIDQQFRNNSYVSLVNTSTVRAGGFTDALATGTEFRITDNKNRFAVSGDGAYSHRFLDQSLYAKAFENGYKASLNLDKINGKFRYGLNQSLMSKGFNINDLGYVGRANYISTSAYARYSVFSPFWIYNNLNAYLSAYTEQLYQPNKFMLLELSGNLWGTFKNFLTAGLDFSYQPFGYNEYYEARTDGRVWQKPVWGRIGSFFSSDYRKTFALDGELSYRRFHNETKEWENADVLEGSLSPRFRFSDRMNMVLSQNTAIRRNSIGFVNKIYDTDGREQIIFGARYYQTLENKITINYLFNNLMSLGFSARHYWALVEYNHFYELQADGKLGASTYNAVHDQNFNAFNIDLIFRWRFAPGSELNVVWKNIILKFDQKLEYNYIHNFVAMFDENQLNQFSIKALYFIDVYKFQPKHKRGYRTE